MSGRQFVSNFSACVLVACCVSSAHAQSMESSLEPEAMSSIDEGPQIESMDMAETMDSTESFDKPQFESTSENTDQMDRSAALDQSALGTVEQVGDVVIPLGNELMSTANVVLGTVADVAVTALDTVDRHLGDMVMKEMETVDQLAQTPVGMTASAMDSVLRPELLATVNNVAGSLSAPLTGDVLSGNSVSDLVSINDGNGTLIGNANSEVYNSGSGNREEEETSDGFLSINDGNGTLLGIANYSESNDGEPGANSGGSGGSGGNGGFLFSNGGGGGSGGNGGNAN